MAPRAQPQRTRLIAIAAVGCFYAGLVALASHEAFSDGDRVDSAGGGPTAGAGDVGSVGIGGQPAGPGAGVDPATGAATAGEPSDGGGEGGRAPSAGPANGGTTVAPGGPAPGDPPAPGPTDGGAGEPIAIGVHDDDPGAAFGQFGVQGGPGTDQGQWIGAIVEWINANGGMGGHPVELVHHVTSSLNGSFDQQAEQACAFFTEDHDVVAVVGGARVPTLNLVDCLARHDTPLVWSYHFMADGATFDAFADHLYMPSMVRADRLGVWMDAVDDAGFFEGGTIGVVRYDTAIHERFARGVVEPALAGRGRTITEEVAFTAATGAASAADLSAQANNAIVRFRSRGVDRVVFVPTAAVMPLLFMAAAEAQGFRPRYTMTTYDSPAFQDANTERFPLQLRGSLAFGWTPAGDVDWEQQPQPLAPDAQRCLEITQGATPTGNSSVRRFCDGLFFLDFLLDNGAEPTTAGIREAVDALGTSYPSAWTFATAMGPARHDGAAVGRVLAYDVDGCRCYAYVGEEIPIP